MAGRLGAAIGRTVTPRRLNESWTDLAIDIGCSRAEFPDLLRRMTWLDEILFRRALRLFPDDFGTGSTNLDTVVKSFETRYTMRFA